MKIRGCFFTNRYAEDGPQEESKHSKILKRKKFIKISNICAWLLLASFISEIVSRLLNAASYFQKNAR